ncbi:MAG TPA: hypothetical protein VFQ73_13295, partial [Flavisolibacter sp.]|nr:hypothetical protein [Flavisolibacter sp.]
MRKKIIPLSWLSIFFTLVLQAQHPARQEVLTKTVDSILQGAVDNKLIPGAVIKIKKDNQVICRKAFGFAERND